MSTTSRFGGGGDSVESRLKQASNQLLALKNEVNEKELALLENDAAFAKQLFHMKKLLGEREKVIAAQRTEIVQLQRGVHHANQSSSQAVQAQFNDFLGQINALKVVVVQLEQKLREKSEEQARLKKSYERVVQDRSMRFDEQREMEHQSSTQVQLLQRKVKSLLQANAALTEQHRREQQSYEIELQRLRGQLQVQGSRDDNRQLAATSAQSSHLEGQIKRLLENESRLQQTISIMADKLQEQEAQASTLQEQEARVQQKANELELARAEFESSVRQQQHNNNSWGGGSGIGESGPHPQYKTTTERAALDENPSKVRELRRALEASQEMCIRLDDEVKSLQKQMQQMAKQQKERKEQITGKRFGGGGGENPIVVKGHHEGGKSEEGLDGAVDEDESVMQCAYSFLMRATALMTQIQCHLDGEVNTAQLPPPGHARAVVYRGTPVQLCHALRSMEQAIPDLQERITDAYAQSLGGECAMQ